MSEREGLTLCGVTNRQQEVCCGCFNSPEEEKQPNYTFVPEDRLFKPTLSHPGSRLHISAL